MKRLITEHTYQKKTSDNGSNNINDSIIIQQNITFSIGEKCDLDHSVARFHFFQPYSSFGIQFNNVIGESIKNPTVVALAPAQSAHFNEEPLKLNPREIIMKMSSMTHRWKNFIKHFNETFW